MKKKEINNLFKPRYKVIADYPLATYSVGKIIKVSEIGEFTPVTHSPWKTDISQYPHLFRLLEWWEDREESEMPEYVINKNGNVYRVTKHYNDEKVNGFSIDGESYGRYYMAYLPATLEQYENRKNQ